MSSHVGDKPGQVFSASVVVWLNIDDYRAASDHHLNVAQDAILLLQLCKQTNTAFNQRWGLRKPCIVTCFIHLSIFGPITIDGDLI